MKYRTLLSLIAIGVITFVAYRVYKTQNQMNPKIEPFETPVELRPVVSEIEKGAGEPIADGSLVEIRYKLFLSNEQRERVKKIDENVSPKPPLRVRLGHSTTVRGLELAILGARVGARRTAFLVPELAYGPEGLPGVIPPSTPLLYDFEIVRIIPLQ